MKHDWVVFAGARLVGSVLLLGCFLALGLLFAMHGMMAMNTRYPEGIERSIWTSALLLGGAAWLQLAAGRGLRRRFDYGFWLASAVAWSVPLGALAVERGRPTSFPLIAALALAAAALQALLYATRRKGSFQPAPSGETGALAARALAIAATVILSAWSSATLMRAHGSLIESGVLDDLRKLQAAQQAYSASNGGHYEGRIECLRAPGPCLGAGEPVLRPEVARRLLIRDPSFYRFQFDAPPPLTADERSRRGARSSTSVTAYALRATPVPPGQSGLRSFCADSTGRVCFNREERVVRPPVVLCPPAPACQEL